MVISNDPANDPRAGGLPKGHPEMSSYLGMPVKGNDGLIAMYGIANRKEGYNKQVAEELSAITTVMTSIIESARSSSLIEKMANRDPLTGAFNRFYFKNHVQKTLVNRSEDDLFCIMMIDFNKFKNINDYYGHEYGDYIIKEFTTRVLHKIKKEDVLARIGGDEFVILIDHIDDIDSAEIIAKRIVDISKNPYIYNNKKLDCSVSIGISCYPAAGTIIDDLLRHSDLALYKAKKSVQGYYTFSSDLQDKYIQQQSLEKDIIKAFENKEFYLLIQPKVDSNTNKIIGGEALIRWSHPTKGIIPPNNFIGAVESMGLSDKLNLYVVQETTKLFNNIEIDSKLTISINISPYIHNLEDNLKKSLAILNKGNIGDQIKIDFEITETSFISGGVDLRRGSEIDNLLSKNNVGLSLDDFGVKYSSINRLFECHFSSLKIDMSFVQKLDGDESKSARTVIEAIMHISSGLDIDIVAEGAETKEQVDVLKDLGCNIVQGYYFYKPLPFEEFKSLVSTKVP